MVKKSARLIVVGLGAMIGITLAALATSSRGHDIGFLEDGSLVHRGRVARSSNAPLRTIYKIERDFEGVRETALREFPHALISASRAAEIELVIPRIEDGRVKVAASPEHRVHLYSGGSNSTLVEVIDYRQPNALESAVLWLRDQLRI